jgi:ubiquinone/menaquinone biosynthesis C-methylase UbiE
MAISVRDTLSSSYIPATEPYIPGIPVAEYAHLIESRFPAFADLLWFDRPGASAALDDLAQLVNEFETDANAGRGASYRHAQRNRMVRARGIRTLFMLAAAVPDAKFITPRWTALDLLGGDGLLAHVFKTFAPHTENSVITSDAAGHMVAGALRAGLPAIRQQAQFLFLRDMTVDAVLLAYGTHHIPRHDRALVCREAARVLRPGGRLVLHDFEEGSPVALWFSEVVDRYARAGHQYDHFSAAELDRCYDQAGLRSVTVHKVYDPLVMPGDSPAEARSRLADYLINMYGLDYQASPRLNRQGVHDAVWELAENYFVYDEGYVPSSGWKSKPSVYQQDGTWVAEVPRVALVAVGQK